MADLGAGEGEGAGVESASNGAILTFCFSGGVEGTNGDVVNAEVLVVGAGARTGTGE